MATIKLPTGLTFAFARIDVPALGVSAGDPNPFWNQVLELGVAGNVIRGATDESLAEYPGIKNTRWIDMQSIQAAVAAGGDVEEMTVFFKVPEADYENEVPVGFPHGTITEPADPADPEGEQVTRQRKWSEWQLNTVNYSDPPLVDGHYYIASTRFNRYLKASEWVPFVVAGSVEVVTSIPQVEAVE